jgi:hypothetical protein
MPSKPNFTSASLAGGRVTVQGQTDPEPEGDIVAIRVVLSQGGKTVDGDVRSAGANWEVELPGDGFSAGSATAFGVETRRENSTTITWTQTVEITG